MELSIRLHPVAGTAYTFGYVKIPASSTVVTAAQAYEVEVSRFVSAALTVPQTMVLGTKELLGGSRPWYTINSTTASLEDENQGQFVFSTTVGSTTFFMEVGYVVDLRGPTNNSTL